MSKLFFSDFDSVQIERYKRIDQRDGDERIRVPLFPNTSATKQVEPIKNKLSRSKTNYQRSLGQASFSNEAIILHFKTVYT